MKIIGLLICASIFVFLDALPTYAGADWFPPPGPGGDTSRSAPGPVIGVGLPALAALGGYIWYRRHQRRK